LLDTQALIVLAQGRVEGLSRRTRALLEDPYTELLLSAVSITEIAVKASLKKLALSENEISELQQDLRLSIIAYGPRHANAMFELPLRHRDPFDRMLIATAIVEAVPLVTNDREIKRYKEITVLW
jgi:PIN domain nuclease of toxin-antitoxin system